MNNHIPKIGVIGSRGITSTYGGVEASVREIYTRLAKRGYDIYIFSENSYSTPELESYDGITVIRLPCIKGKHSETLSRSLLATLSGIKSNLDIIHFHAQGSGILSPLIRLVGNRSILTVHGLDWKRDKWSLWAKMCIQLAEKTAVRFINNTVVVSHVLQRYFRDTYDYDTTYIPNGVTLKPLSITSRGITSLSLIKDEYILFASHLVPEKGCHDLIDVFNSINTTYRLVIAGESRYDTPYISMLKKKADPCKIIFTGHVTGAILDELYTNAYLFVLPSYIEGLSLALLEALSFGTCPLVSDIPENLEVIEDHGYSFHLGNNTSFRSTLEDLLTSTYKVKQKAVTARPYIANKYNWDSVADAYHELYRSII
jgi:glycosyltransferase involved in cell wall biosynthesis